MPSFRTITFRPAASLVLGLLLGVVSVACWQQQRSYDVARRFQWVDTKAPIVRRTRIGTTRISPLKAALGKFYDGTYPSQPVVPDVSKSARNEDDEDVQETTYRINLQLAQLAQNAAHHNQHRSKRSQLATQALRLFESGLTHPDTVSYNSLLKVLAKASPCFVDAGDTVSCAQVALDMFREMEQVHQQQTEANQVFYERLEQEISPSARQDVVVRVRPNVRTYATLLDAWSRMGNVEAATQCQQLLEEFFATERERNGSLDNSGDWLVCYNTVLAAWAKVGGSVGAAKCLALWQDMLSNPSLGVQPDRISFHTVLNALAKSGRSDAGAVAEGLLREQMQQRQQSNHTFQLTARSYTTVMDAWGRSSGRPDRAHALLNELVALASSPRNKKNKDLQPSLVSYTAVIHAYATSNLRDKAWRAYQVFQQMQQQNQRIRPNCVTYNAMLNCCATSLPTPIVSINNDQGVDDADRNESPRHNIMEMVIGIYRQFLDQAPAGSRETNNSDDREYVPDVATFATVLKACSRHRHPLLDAEHLENFAESVFFDACSFGCISPSVLWQLQQAVPIDRYRALLQEHLHGENVGQWLVGREQLPASWTRQVPLEEWHNTHKGRGRRNDNRQR